MSLEFSRGLCMRLCFGCAKELDLIGRAFKGPMLEFARLQWESFAICWSIDNFRVVETVTAECRSFCIFFPLGLILLEYISQLPIL